MKAIFFCLSLFAAVHVNAATYPLKDALSKKLVAATAYGMVGGSHEGQSINMELTNRSTQPIVVSIDAGQTLLPEDTSVQNMMVTRDELITIQPGKKAKVVLYAFCIEMSNGGPGINDTFSIGTMAKEPLTKLAKFLSGKKYQGEGVQSAIWCISDGNELTDIVCNSVSFTNELRQMVANLSGQKYVAYAAPAQPKPQQYLIRTTSTTAKPYKLYSGSVSLTAPPGVEIRIVLVDDKGTVIRELYKDAGGGEAKPINFPFQLDGRTLEEKMYFVRYYIGGQRVRDIPVNNMKLKGIGF